MQGNVNIPDSNITTNLTFRQLVLMNMQQLTNFPYIEKDFDALTDYELLCLVVKFLNDVIANQNEQNDSITRMYQSFLALQDYVNNTKDELEDAFNTLDNYVRNFFDNLDVQDEIDNKLDEMLENGVLEQIIEQFLQATALWCFDNVANMKTATNLINGSFVKTLGYYTANDGGASTYKIRTKTNEDTTDEMFLIALHDNTLVAELIYNELCVNQIGCKGDGVFDNTAILNNLLSHRYAKNINFAKGQTYLCSSKVTITKEFTINGNFSTLKSNSNEIAFSININNEDESTVHEAYAGEIKNIKFEAPSSTVVLENTNGYKGVIKDCYFNDFYGIGLYHINGYEMLYENLRFWAKGTSATGIRSANNDVHFNNIFMCDCHTGFSLQGSANFINNFHAWIFTSANYENSKCIEITGQGTNFIEQSYIDSYNYGFYFSGYGHIHANEIMCLFNNDFSASLDEKTTSFIDYANSDIANYDWQTYINDIYIVGGSENTKFSSITPENLHGEMYVTQSNIADYTKYNTNYYDLTFPTNATVRLKEVTREKENVHLRLIVTLTDATSGYNSVCAFKHSTAPKNTGNIVAYVSNSEFMTSPYLQMCYIDATRIQVNLTNAGTQTVYLDINYLARNDRRGI